MTFLITADTYIDSKIKGKISDISYIQYLAKILRSFSIADDKGSIIYDHGGEKLLKNIKVEKDKQNDLKYITITTKSYLQNAPLLNIIDWQNYFYTSEKTGSHDWKYTLQSSTVFLDGKHQPPYPAKIVIEVLR